MEFAVEDWDVNEILRVVVSAMHAEKRKTKMGIKERTDHFATRAAVAMGAN